MERRGILPEDQVVPLLQVRLAPGKKPHVHDYSAVRRRDCPQNVSRRAVLVCSGGTAAEKLVGISVAVLDEFAHCPERAFATRNCRDVPQSIMKADLCKRSKICRSDLAGE